MSTKLNIDAIPDNSIPGSKLEENLSLSNDLIINGNIYANYVYSDSDENIKNFTNDIDVDLSLLKNIPKKYFTYKNNPIQQSIGTSAQELKKFYPELVSSRDEILSVDYAKLSVVALAAIDKLTDKIEELEQRLSNLEK